jgi:hypothetical protein
MGRIDAYPSQASGGTTIPQQVAAPIAAMEALWLDTDEGAGVGLSSILAYADVITQQGGLTAETDLAGLSVTVTVPAGRRIRVTAHDYLQNTAAGNLMYLTIYQDGAQVQSGQLVSGGVNMAEKITTMWVGSPSAGSHIYKARAGTAAGTATSIAGAQYPGFILVEDITGTLWPAGQSIGAGAIASEQWTAYTPTLNQGGAVTKTVNYARYTKIGRTVTAAFELTVTGAGVANNAIQVGLPFLPVYGVMTGPVLFYDASAAAGYISGANLDSTTPIFQMWATGSATSPAFLGGSASPFGSALASGDVIRGTVTYEATS